MSVAPLAGEASPALTLSQLNQRISGLLSSPGLRDVWVTAELSDFRRSGGHCYMELMEKIEPTGAVAARLRGIIWANQAPRICSKFAAMTGQQLATGIKVMVRGTVNYHASYGMSFVISDIEPSFTVGDVERRRREILRRLEAEGILELNRSLEWPVPALRVAIISAPGAAGYGDFIHQLYNNPSRLKFVARLFPAVVQGERTVPSVIEALERIAADDEGCWDCVVIIRGGGATSDLISFDDYTLAANIAQFPLPVIVGIGHERDVTVLDFVANMRVKTPTAAAEWLVGRAQEQLDRLRAVSSDMLHTVTERISGSLAQLAYIEGQLPLAPRAAIERASSRLQRAVVAMEAVSARCISPRLSRLDGTAAALAPAVANQLARRGDRLAAMETLLDALSPAATLRRGYSITRVNGRALRSASQLSPGTVITTTLAEGTVKSTVTE